MSSWTLIYARSCCSTSLLRYLQPGNKLPTLDEAGLPPSITQEVNRAVQDALRAESTKGKKRKYTSFTAEERASIGCFAAEHERISLYTNIWHTQRSADSNKCLACGCGQNRGAKIAIIRFAIFLQNPVTQSFYYAIKTCRSSQPLRNVRTGPEILSMSPVLYERLICPGKCALLDITYAHARV